MRRGLAVFLAAGHALALRDSSNSPQVTVDVTVNVDGAAGKQSENNGNVPNLLAEGGAAVGDSSPFGFTCDDVHNSLPQDGKIENREVFDGKGMCNYYCINDAQQIEINFKFDFFFAFQRIAVQFFKHD